MIRFTILILIVGLVACNADYQAKPRAYKQIDLPKQHSYQLFNDAKFPYEFEYPVYSKVIKDSTYFSEEAANDYWINVDFGQYKCKVYLSYNAVNGTSTYKKLGADGKYIDSVATNSFEKLVSDAFKLTSKHEVKSSGKKDKVFKTADGSGGIYFNVDGQVASPIQFFISDTTKHFLRGALYYDASPNTDSTRPLTNFFEKDIEHLIKTFKWRK